MFQGLQGGFDGNDGGMPKVPMFSGGLLSTPPAYSAAKVKPFAGFPKRNVYDDYVDNVFNEYPSLKSFASPKDFLVRDADGKMKEILAKNKFGLEYQNKGQEDYQVGDDSMKLDNPDKHRIYIDPDQIKPEDRYDAIKMDMVSHSMHNNPEYSQFSKDLETKLITKFGRKMVEGNDGVDAYVRGYLSKSKEYQPYKDELKFLPKGYMEKLDEILKKEPKK